MHCFRATLLLSLILNSVTARADEPVNLLKNPSMEEASKGDDGKDQPVAWTAGDTVPGVTYDWSKASGVKKSGALHIKKTANTFFPIAQWSQTFDHDGKSPALQVSTLVKAKNAKKAILDVVFLNEQGEWISHEWVAYIGQKEPRNKPATHDFKEYSGTVAIPANTKRIVVAFQDYGPGEVWFDEAKAVYRSEVPAGNKNAP